MHCRLFKIFLLLLLLSPATDLAAQDATATSWTNAAGTKIEAEFVRLTDDGVILRLKSNGREAEIPLSSLSIDSHLQAIKLAKPQAFSKPLVKAEIKIAALELVQLDPAKLLQSPFPTDCSVEQFLQIVKSEFQAGNPMVFWHALPPGMQTDSEDVILMGMELGKPFLVQLKVLLRHFDTIVQQKRSFVLGHPLVAAQPELVSKLEEVWPAVAAFTAAISDETLWESENFRKGNIANWLAQYAAKVGPATNALNARVSGLMPQGLAEASIPAQATANPEDLDYRILSQSANSAEVELTNKGQSMQTITLGKVRGRWVPKEMLDNWPRWVGETKKSISAITPNDLSMPKLVVGGLVGAVGNLARASSQQDFDAAIEQLTALIPGAAGMPGPGAGAPGGQGPRGGQAPRGGPGRPGFSGS